MKEKLLDLGIYFYILCVISIGITSVYIETKEPLITNTTIYLLFSMSLAILIIVIFLGLYLYHKRKDNG